MFNLLPKAKPNVANFKKLVDSKVKCSDAVYLVGVRGYFKDTMGKVGVNDIGMYDDAIGIISQEALVTFNFNVDPSRQKKGMANLKANSNPGWLYKRGIHGLNKPKSLQYEAFVQADKVTVKRFEQGDDTGFFGINIHRGGFTGTSSLGCQTVPREQWEAFKELAFSLMKKHNQKTIRYFLIEA